MPEEDEALVLRYLSGLETRSKRGRSSMTYLESGGSEELKARQVLTRHLLSVNAFSGLDPLSIKIRQALAGVFSPDDLCASERTIKFYARRRGKPTQLRPRLAVGSFLWNRTALRGECICGKDPVKFESVIKEAEQTFGLKRRAVLYAWNYYRKLLELRND